MEKQFIVKTDVANELRTELYYNQLEVQRLFNDESGNYQNKVKDIASLLKRNSTILASLELLERYIPTPQQAAPQSVQTPDPGAPTADSALTKVE